MVNQMSISTYSGAQTRKLGAALGALLEAGDVVLLYGELGSGKTTFAQGVASGLGIAGDVTSPTFTLLTEYEDGRMPLLHADLYRLDGDREAAFATGLEDYLDSDAAVLIEWPEAVADDIADALHVRIERAPLPRVDERDLICRATGPRSFTLLDEWVKKWLF